MQMEKCIVKLGWIQFGDTSVLSGSRTRPWILDFMR